MISNLISKLFGWSSMFKSEHQAPVENERTVGFGQLTEEAFQQYLGWMAVQYDHHFALFTAVPSKVTRIQIKDGYLRVESEWGPYEASTDLLEASKKISNGEVVAVTLHHRYLGGLTLQPTFN